MCRPDDFPPYAVLFSATPLPDSPIETAPDPGYNGWRNRATWSAWQWLSGGDEMVFRLARARLRRIPKPTPANVGAMARSLLDESGGPIFRTEIESAGGLGAVDWSEIGSAVVDLFDGDDRL